jgi:hypothetical protein
MRLCSIMYAALAGGIPMTPDTELAHGLLESQVAEKYRALGCEVIVAPEKGDLPFDLGTYRPDLIAKKSPSEGYIIEVKGSVSRTPIDRYREIAELVSQHTGWRFLLVTGEDVSLSDREWDAGELLTWDQMLQRKAHAEQLLAVGEAVAAFLFLWGILEAALRRQAAGVSIPVERLPTTSLINHLYSQGELSLQQWEKVKSLQAIRNRTVHGYQTPSLDEHARQLQELVRELLRLWVQQ